MIILRLFHVSFQFQWIVWSEPRDSLSRFTINGSSRSKVVLINPPLQTQYFVPFHRFIITIVILPDGKCLLLYLYTFKRIEMVYILQFQDQARQSSKFPRAVTDRDIRCEPCYKLPPPEGTNSLLAQVAAHGKRVCPDFPLLTGIGLFIPTVMLGIVHRHTCINSHFPFFPEQFGELVFRPIIRIPPSFSIPERTTLCVRMFIKSLGLQRIGHLRPPAIIFG